MSLLQWGRWAQVPPCFAWICMLVLFSSSTCVSAQSSCEPLMSKQGLAFTGFSYTNLDMVWNSCLVFPCDMAQGFFFFLLLLSVLVWVPGEGVPFFTSVGIPYMRQLWCVMRIHPGSSQTAWISLTCGGVRLHLALPHPFLSCVSQGLGLGAEALGDLFGELSPGSVWSRLLQPGMLRWACRACTWLGPEAEAEFICLWLSRTFTVAKSCLGSLKHDKVQVSSSLKMLLLNPVTSPLQLCKDVTVCVTLTCTRDFL